MREDAPAPVNLSHLLQLRALPTSPLKFIPSPRDPSSAQKGGESYKVGIAMAENLTGRSPH